MKRIPVLVRVLLIPAAFVLIVSAILMFPNDADFKGAEDIYYYELNGEMYDSPEDIQSLVEWMYSAFGKMDVCFVKQNEAFMHEDSEWRLIVYRVPDEIKGIDEGMKFGYSIYRMYVYLENGKLYYNGVEYDEYTLFDKG